MHHFRPPASPPVYPRPREIVAAIGAGAALCFGAKYVLAAILIIFMALGNQ